MTNCRFVKMLGSSEMLCAFSYGELKTLVRLMVKCSCLVVMDVGHQQLCRKSVAL